MARVIPVADGAELARRAARLLIDQLHARPDSLLVLPTGNTPLGMFRELVAARGRADFSRARFATLDEYRGIGPDDRRRLFHWLSRELFEPLGIAGERILAFDPAAEPDAEAARVEAALTAAGGIDLAVLGLGPNGHLGFNEPGSPFDSRTRRVALAPASIRSNAAYWGSEADVPREGFTLGLGTLRDAKRLVMLVSGARKREILARARRDAIGPDLPATLLRLHAHAAIIADRDALGEADPAASA